MRATDEHGHLSPATRARTILAGCHRIDLVEVGGDAGAADAAGLVEGEGGAYLVLAQAGRIPSGRVRLTCRTPIDGLGMVQLLGDAGRAHPLADLPAFEHLAADGSGDDGATGPEPAALIVVPVDVDDVWLLLPAVRRRHAHVVPVPLDSFLSAEADAWAVSGPATAARLEDRHQAELRRVASGALGGRAVSAVVVRRIDTEGLGLGCLDADGVTPLTVPFGRPIRDPEALRQWLRRAARRG